MQIHFRNCVQRKTISGAGDGGCVIALTEQSKKDSVVENMSTKYETYPITIEKIGMQVNITN